ncbi:ankyrin repeat domain-containing protein [Dyella psychrodurans]|uniref:Ankyrin repeat domain-containing protein n=1 Tax=Dyella psychrodurans TaxID=1927960 RepID=A0A370XBN2_9GAMM|nr:ankyrin repeat domain-containing protein [Dyella psychrodurans]RDS85834.1 ankyrin repeat domain-containing protein [Dyella psychrodurans]
MSTTIADGPVTAVVVFDWTRPLPWRQSSAVARTQGVRELLKHIPAGRVDRNGWTAVHAVAHSGNAALLRSLLKRHPELVDAQQDTRVGSGPTPLHAALAAIRPAEGVITALLAAGADPRRPGTIDIRTTDNDSALRAVEQTPRDICEVLMDQYPAEQPCLERIRNRLLAAERAHDRRDLEQVAADVRTHPTRRRAM